MTDAIAVRVRLADSVRVPMRGDHDALGRTPLAGQHRQHVVALEARVLQRKVGREARSRQLDRPEVRGPSARLQRVEVETGLAEQRHRRVALEPRLQQQLFARRIGSHDVVAFAVWSDGRVPAVTGPRRLVDDQRADGPAAHGFLVLVGPARVIRRGLAVEPSLHRVAGLRFEVGIVDQEYGDLAAQVRALVVVPMAFRRGDAITDEHERRAVDADAIDRAQRQCCDILVLHEAHRLAADRDADVRVGGYLRADQRHDLGPAALVAGRFQAQRLELFDEIRHGLRLARRAGRAPLELVRSERASDARQSLDADRARVEVLRAGRGHTEGGRRKGAGDRHAACAGGKTAEAHRHVS